MFTPAPRKPIRHATPWHRESYDRFLNDTLPALLTERLPLDVCIVRVTGEYTCEISLVLPQPDGDPITVIYSALPYPDADGIFVLPALKDSREGTRRVVPVIATSEDLEAADIRCVGEQLRDDFAARLADLPTDIFRAARLTLRDGEAKSAETGTPRLAAYEADPETALRTWLPLNEWLLEFLSKGQHVDTTNWLAEKTHLRRLVIPLGEKLEGFHPSQIGRVCPIETPEGPNTGRVLVLASGATIRDGKIVIEDSAPDAGLGLGASLIPFLNHSETCRTLMGANMMRQWHPLPDAEPPLVQTGAEPNPTPDRFWCGVNLLTAFVSWGAGTHEDAIIVSASAANRLGYPYPLEAGDKLSNRHGAKGVVSRILSDTEMPHLPDGTPVELIYPFFGLPSRMNHGQLLEAVAGRVAQAEGTPIISSALSGLSLSGLQERLRAVGLPETGMERLTDGKDGAPLKRDSSVGYVYWGRTAHDARDKVQVIGNGAANAGQRLRRDEYRLLAEQGAWNVLYSLFVEQTQGRGTFAFSVIQRRLAALGIAAAVGEGGVAFRFEESEDPNAVHLAVPVPHPYLRERELNVLGPADLPEAFGAVRTANERVIRMQRSGAPSRLLEEGVRVLRQRVREFADALLLPETFTLDVRAQWSARTVIAPGSDLTIEQIGLPDPIARTLFGGEGVSDAEIDTRMAQSWVLANRQPSLYPTSIVAFRPVRCPGYAIRWHPLVCNWLDADFDGDQIAVFLPRSNAAQKEAGELLSVRAHLSHAPARLLSPYGGLLPGHAVTYGLAEHARTEEGRKEIAGLLGGADLPAAPCLNRQTVSSALHNVLRERGVDAVLTAVQELARLGFAAAKRSGASLGAFLGRDLALPPTPEGDDIAEWDTWGEEVTESLNALARQAAFEDAEMGAALLSAASGARGRTMFLAKFIASVSPGTQADLYGRPVPMRHGWRDGLTLDELYIVASNSRKMLRQMMEQEPWLGEDSRVPRSEGIEPKGNGVIARALRSNNPGVVFASAAKYEEVDPLADPDSRVLVGLPPER
jgi:hypothetical protein